MKYEILTDYPDKDLEKKWFAFLPESNYASHYTSPGFFTSPYWKGAEILAIAVLDADKMVGVSTGIRTYKKYVSGIEVRPQVAISRNADEREVVEKLVEGAIEAAGGENELITFHSYDKIEAFEDSGFKAHKAEGTYEVVRLNLSEGADEIFKGFSQSRRSDIRKAMRQKKIKVSQVENEDELRQLYEIHKNWCVGKGIKADTWEMMKTANSQPEYQRIFIAKHDEKVIAGSYFRFYEKGVMEYAANNSMPEFQRLRPNDLLVWRSIEWACEQGMKQYSMGGSHLFLRRFGGEIHSSYRYQLDRSFLQKHEKKEAVENLAIKTYQSLPVSTRQKLKKILGRD